MPTEQKLTLREAASRSVSHVMQLWQTARIPHQRIDSGVGILTKLYDDYAKLKKNRKRSNEQDKKNQEEFIGRLQRLFDIATSDALTTMKIEEDRQFLIKQCNDVLSCSMSGVDVTLQGSMSEKIASSSTAAEQKIDIHSSSSSSSTSSDEDSR